MAKSVFKEIIIMMLLCIAILLIFGVIFYEYIPANKIIPNKIAYTTPENITQEIAEEVNEAGFVNIVYQLDQSEINMSKRVGDYKSGKQNPFETIVSEQTNAGQSDGSESKDTESNTPTGINTNTENSSNNEIYLPNNGTK